MDSLDRYKVIAAIEESLLLPSQDPESIPAWLACRQTLWTYQEEATPGWITKRLKDVGRRLRAVGRLIQARAVERTSLAPTHSHRSAGARIAFVGRRAHMMSESRDTCMPRFDRTLECAKQGAAEVLGRDSILVFEFESVGKKVFSGKRASLRDLLGAVRDYRKIRSLLQPILKMVAKQLELGRFSNERAERLGTLCTLNIASMLLSRAHWRVLLSQEDRISHLFIAAWYFPDAMGLIAAAHERELQVVDVQHGQQGAIHGMYCGWRAFATYAHALPDYFWVWNRYTADNIRRSSDPAIAEKLVVGGRCLPLADLGVQPASAESVGARMDRGQTVLIALQPENRDSDNPISPEALEYLAHLKPSRIIVKPHPAMGDDYLGEALEALSHLPSTLDVRSPQEPLATSMSLVSLHMTSHSSSVFDAIHAGVPSILWGSLAGEQFKGVTQAGLGWILDDAPTTWDSIRSKWTPSENEYFQPTDLRAARDNALMWILSDHASNDVDR